MKKIVYIGGYGRSGSTYLDIELGKRLNSLSSGELFRLFAELEKGGLCSCGQQLTDCSIWGQYGNLHEGFDLEQSRKLTQAFESTIFKNLGFRKIYTRFFSVKSKAAYFNILRGVFDFAFTGNTTVIDSSKTSWNASWRPLRLRSLDCNIYFVHVYRPLLDVLKSVQKGTNQALMGVSDEKPLRVLRAAIGWLYANFVAFFYRIVFRENYRYVRQVELQHSGEVVIDSLVDFISPEKVPGSGGGAHLVAGNRNKFTK